MFESVFHSDTLAKISFQEFKASYCQDLERLNHLKSQILLMLDLFDLTNFLDQDLKLCRFNLLLASDLANLRLNR